MFLNSLKSDVQPVQRVTPPTPVPRREPIPEPEIRTLAEIKEINPYDFPPQGFRCTVTLSKYNDTQSWWFPSCNRCSKTCLPFGNGYKCPRDQCTGCKFKYKPCFLGTDGTTEAEFVFFDDIGRRLIGKDVKQLIKSSDGSDGVPKDIAAQIGQKYQFTINVTTKAFKSSKFSYDVKRIDCAYGRQPVIPAINPAYQNTAARQDKVNDASESSSDNPSLENANNTSALHDVLQSPETQCVEIQNVVTPPPTISPTTLTTITSKLSTEKTKDDEVEDVDPTLEDEDADIDKSGHLSDSDKLRRGSSKKIASSKKPKKN
ncbi:hypothetical protein QOZ80_9AG0671610 [Eleusine coracana subsp. coracana]|nr:hypothetical protein QOZ80_9AG0671610 [Eleusine coracana subsp. coracana]